MARKPVHGPDTIVRRGAIMIIDQAGFTRRVLHRGTAVALDAIWKMRRLVIPVLRKHGAEVFKVDADNLYAFFDDVEQAIEAATEAHRLLAREERRKADPLQICVGIGFGELYYLSSEDDYYGPQVNLASKLGEDIAEGGETLVTEHAVAAISRQVEGTAGKVRYSTVSGVRVRYRQWLT